MLEFSDHLSLCGDKLPNMTTNTYRSTHANVPGRSARHRAEQLRKGAYRLEATPRLATDATPERRRASIRKPAGFAVIAWLAGLYFGMAVAFTAAFVVFVVAASLGRARASRSVPAAPASPKGRRIWVAPTEEELREADNYDLGAEGEEETGRILSALEAEGWTILHDRRIEHSSANLDHIAVGPRGQIVVIDSKKMRPIPGAVLRATWDEQGLRYGDRDRTKIVGPVMMEARKAEANMLVMPSVLVVVHGVDFWGPLLRCRGVLVVRPDKLLDEVRRMPGLTDRPHMAGYLDREFPPYLD